MSRLFPLAIVSVVPTPIHPQEAPDYSLVQYDWRAGSFEGLERVRPRDLVRIEILHPNLFCYTYEISVDQVAIEEATINPTDYFGAFARLGEAGDEQLVQESPAQMPDQIQNALRVSIPGGATRLQAQREQARADSLKAIVDSIVEIRREKGGLARDVAGVTRAKGQAGRAVEESRLVLCPTEGRGNPIDRTRPIVLDAVTRIDEFIVALYDVPALRGRLRPFGQRIDAIERRAIVYGELYGEPEVAQLLRELLDEERRALDGIEATLEELGGESIGALRGVKAELDATTTPDTLRRMMEVRPNTGSLSVAITASGKPGIPTVAGKKHEDAFEIAVEQRHRMFVSLGFVWSTVDEDQFERVNRIAPGAGEDAETADSTFSTYADTSEESTIGFAPAVLFNVSMTSIDDLVLYASGGVAARSVNESVTPPDFLLGVSGGVRDRLLVSLLLHRARIERLLLGDPDTVSTRPVPSTITDESAVGTGARWGLALAFTLRTN